MSRVNEMTLKEILDKTDLIIKWNDIAYFCDDLETMKELLLLEKKKPLDNKIIKEFLLQHENKINKEKLLLLIVNNYQENIQKIEEILVDIDNTLSNKIVLSDNERVKQLKDEFQELKLEKYRQEQSLKIAKKLGKDIEEIIAIYFYDNEKKEFDIKVVKSKEIMSNITKKNGKGKKRFKEIDEDFRQQDANKTIGIEYVLQPIVLTDFCEIFPNEQIGDDMRTLILENSILRNKVKTKEELLKIKKEDCNEYNRLVEGIEFKKIMPDIKDVIEKYAQYIDFDKLLLICAYRYEEGLENRIIHDEDIDSVKDILHVMLGHVKDKKKTFKFKVQYLENNSYKMKDIEYSAKDIKRCMERVIDHSYITKAEIQQNKEKINSGEANLFDFNFGVIDVMFSAEDLEKIATLNDENLQYVANKLEWDRQKIIKKINQKGSCSTELLKDFITQKKILSDDMILLYMNKKIELNQIRNIKENIDLSKSINSDELIQYYKYSIEKETKEENKQDYLRYLELYKEILIKDKPEEIEIRSTELMEQMVENYQKDNTKEYIEQLKEYYKEGILTLSVILEWNDESIIEDFITDLYKEKVINLESINNFIKKGNLPFRYIEELVFTKDISYDERMEILEQGWVPEEEIFRLFSETLIREEDLIRLSKHSIINRERTEDIIHKTSLKDLENHSNIVLEIDDTLQKIRRDESLYSKQKDKEHSKIENKSPKLIIDPNEREELFSLLGAR